MGASTHRRSAWPDGTPPTAHGYPHRAQPRTDRLSHLDNLKALLVAWIIFGHALLGYVAYSGWEYAEVREVTFGPTAELVLSAIFAPSALVVIGTFFLVAGLFLPASLTKHGYRRFVTRRLLHLGGPYAVFALLL
jgi:fucose 4-O-acetylase-like acetyltransferase